MRLLSFAAIPRGTGKWIETSASLLTVLSVVISATVYILIDLTGSATQF